MKKLLLVISILLFLNACDATVDPFVPVVTTVELSPKAAQLETGNTLQMIANVYDQRGGLMIGEKISWTSNNIVVATVSNTGVVTARSKGQTLIGADVGGKFTTSTIFVIDPTVAAVGIQANIPSPFYVGQTVQATAVIKDSQGRDLNMYAALWQTSNASVVTVTDKGLITAVGVGTATISVSSGGKAATLNVTVVIVPVNTVTLTATDSTVSVGQTRQVQVVLRDASGNVLAPTGRTFVWSSTNPAIASVSSTGLVRGIIGGQTLITCVVENKVGIISITVVE